MIMNDDDNNNDDEVQWTEKESWVFRRSGVTSLKQPGKARCWGAHDRCFGSR